MARQGGGGGGRCFAFFPARTNNGHPVSFPGVRAEAGPVPAEHLSGPVPAAAPQEGPHAAQVHRGRNVRHVANET